MDTYIHLVSDVLALGGFVHALATSFLRRLGLAAPLPHPVFAARGMGLALLPTPGLGEPARLENGVVLFDPEHLEHREHIASIACGAILRRAGRHDDEDQRTQLALLLGLAMPTREAALAERAEFKADAFESLILGLLGQSAGSLAGHEHDFMWVSSHADNKNGTVLLASVKHPRDWLRRTAG